MSETAFRSNNEASLNTDQISDAVDKIDMSLGRSCGQLRYVCVVNLWKGWQQDKLLEEDDIIKLNRREQRIARMSGMAQNWHRGPWLQKGIPRKGPQQTKSFNRIGIRGRRLQPPSRRRPQGVLTGLALRKAQPLNKGVSPLNRQAFHMMRARQMLQGRLNTYRQPSGLWMPLSASSSRSGLPANSFRPLMTLPVLQSQKDARQATFLFRRGLTVQTPLHPGSGQSLVSQRTRRWRMTTTNNGILTVSIDNPAARLFAESSRTQLPLSLIKQEESEPKIPKGVPLQFDINSVGKQTAMTLNERFKILKEQRTANSYLRGSRFITVG
ncbi:UAP56-interacting factor-like isoform X1 [Polypterus senegalus]|uniref:UAP56-interacting factor-like isoform X1 n=1 Tax=Polypterus senegalus TaxID=55291 RepID=UPI001966720E|nr:UAP56-interacting factor-like isoform X1 [Polypterus senegalus]